MGHVGIDDAHDWVTICDGANMNNMCAVNNNDIVLCDENGRPKSDCLMVIAEFLNDGLGIWPGICESGE